MLLKPLCLQSIFLLHIFYFFTFSFSAEPRQQSILFLAPKLLMGGTEKSFIDLLHYLPPPLWRYHICILERGGILEPLLPKQLHYISFNEAKAYHYDVAISFAQWIPTDLLTKKISADRRVQWCHVDLSTINIPFPIQKAKNRKNIDIFIGVSEAASRSIIALDKKLKTKTITIHNYVNEPAILQKAREPQQEILPQNDTLNLITVGRLAPEKGIERAIQVHKRLHTEGFRFHWYFVGGGSLLQKLKAQVSKAGLTDYMHFLGIKFNPFPYIRAADIFVLCSFSESWSLVVSEAMLLHKPILTTKLKGVCEQITNGKNGLIVPNTAKGLYEGIKRMLLDKNLRIHFQKELNNFHYDNDAITKKLEQLFSQD